MIKNMIKRDQSLFTLRPSPLAPLKLGFGLGLASAYSRKIFFMLRTLPLALPPTAQHSTAALYMIYLHSSIQSLCHCDNILAKQAQIWSLHSTCRRFKCRTIVVQCSSFKYAFSINIHISNIGILSPLHCMHVECYQFVKFVASVTRLITDINITAASQLVSRPSRFTKATQAISNLKWHTFDHASVVQSVR
eukprot:g80028.t1